MCALFLIYVVGIVLLLSIGGWELWCLLVRGESRDSL